MANKTTKKSKSTAKPTVAKKTPVKTVTRKQPVMNSHECGCGHECHCCAHHGCGHRFVSICIKCIILLMVFFLGCVASPWFIKNPAKHMMPRVAFDDNGCVVLESVKCPKMLEVLATADSDANDCISRDEFRVAMHDMHSADFPKMDKSDDDED